MSDWPTVRSTIQQAVLTAARSTGATIPDGDCVWLNDRQPWAREPIRLRITVSGDELPPRLVQSGAELSVAVSSMVRFTLTVRCESVFQGSGFTSLPLLQRIRAGLSLPSTKAILTAGNVTKVADPLPTRSLDYTEDGMEISAHEFDCEFRAEMYLDPSPSQDLGYFDHTDVAGDVDPGDGSNVDVDFTVGPP